MFSSGYSFVKVRTGNAAQHVAIKFIYSLCGSVAGKKLTQSS